MVKGGNSRKSILAGPRLLVVIHRLVAVFLYQFVTFGGFQVLAHHFGDEFVEGDFGGPAEFGFGLGWVAEQGFDFGGTEIARVDCDDALLSLALSLSPGPSPACGGGEVAFFFDAFALPTNFHAKLFGGGVDEVSDRVLHAGGDDEVFRFVLLQHQPLHFDVVLGVAPVALGVHVAEVETVLQTEFDARQGAGDFAGDEGFAADRAFMVEQDAVAGVHAIGFAVVDGDPVGVELGAGVGTARVERGGFFLRGFLHEAEQFAGAGLVEAGFLVEAEDADGFQDAQGTEGVGVGGVFGFFEADGDVALRGEVVDFVGLNLLDDADEAGAVGEVAVVQDELAPGFVRVLIEVVDSVGVEQRGAAFDAVHFVALV